MDIAFTAQEMRDLYRVLNLREKLESGQAVLETRWTAPNYHTGVYGDVVKSQTVDIKLTVNGYRICVAHRMLKQDGSLPTEPDPKYIHVDELKFRLGSSS